MRGVDGHRWIEIQAHREATRRAAQIETACEMALQMGDRGVLVDDGAGTAEPHPDVPYGEIHVRSASIVA